jgi:hypothetical protein
MAKSIEQQLAEATDKCRAKGININEVCNPGMSLSERLEKLNEATGNVASREKLIAAAMRVFPELCPTKEAAAMFVNDKPINSEFDALTKAVLGGN